MLSDKARCLQAEWQFLIAVEQGYRFCCWRKRVQNFESVHCLYISIKSKLLFSHTLQSQFRIMRIC